MIIILVERQDRETLCKMNIQDLGKKVYIIQTLCLTLSIVELSSLYVIYASSTAARSVRWSFSLINENQINLARAGSCACSDFQVLQKNPITIYKNPITAELLWVGRGKSGNSGVINICGCVPIQYICSMTMNSTAQPFWSPQTSHSINHSH